MGSFIKAAHALELPRATVSAAIKLLEQELGVRLLQRTTRQVKATSDGEVLLGQARSLLAQADKVANLFSADRQQVKGRLVVDMPSRIARKLVIPALPQLLTDYPGLVVHLHATDRASNLVQDGIDCTVRVGELADSTLVVRRLGSLALINCASPAYLQAAGTPRTPDELAARHQCVGYASPFSGRELEWEYMEDGVPKKATMSSRLIVNNAENYISACREGLGLIQIPRYDVQDLLDNQRLIEILPGYRAASMPISILYSHRGHRTRRLEVFIDWFEQLIAPYLD